MEGQNRGHAEAACYDKSLIDSPQVLRYFRAVLFYLTPSMAFMTAKASAAVRQIGKNTFPPNTTLRN